MHKHHTRFLRGIREARRVLITFFSDLHGCNQTRWCAPMGFSFCAGPNGKRRYYHFWDSVGEPDSDHLILPSNKIVSMRLTEYPFDPSEFLIPTQAHGNDDFTGQADTQ